MLKHKKDGSLDVEYWKYISAIQRQTFGEEKTIYDSIGIKEGYFNSNNELVGYTDGFEKLSFPLEEGHKVLIATLKMMLKDIQKDKRILDERLGVKQCVTHFNNQPVRDLASRPISPVPPLPKPSKSK